MLIRKTLRFLTNAGALRRPLTTTTSSTVSQRPEQQSLESSDWTPGKIRHGSQWHNKDRRRPARGGQNLSARYVRLENAVRGKQAASGAIGALAHAEATNTSPEKQADQGKRKAVVEMFHGFVVPEVPKPPADDECCMSGCAVCVYDLHEEELEAYDGALRTLRTSLGALGIPQDEWPARIRPPSSSSSSASLDTSRKGAVLTAFEEMERKLAEKHKDDSKGGGALALEGSKDTADTTTDWRERQKLAAGTRKAVRRREFWAELYEGVRWALFSNR